MQKTKKHCDKAKKLSWADYKEKINSVEAANTFRKIIESSTRHTLGTLKKNRRHNYRTRNRNPGVLTHTTLPLIHSS